MIWLRLLPLWSWLKRNPLLALCAILAVWGLYERHQAHRWQDRAEQCASASQAAAEATRAMRARELQQVKEQAAHAEQEHAAALAAVRRNTGAFIRAHRVRPSGGVSPTVAVSEADPAAVRQNLPADPVMVGSSDVQACGEWVAYGTALREWALEVSR